MNILLKEKQKLFHTADLALLWGIENRNTLYTTIKRYVQKGIFIPVHKGLYSTVSLSSLNPYLIGIKSLHLYAYVSAETVLYSVGCINQPPQSVTLISSVSRRFIINKTTYTVRQLGSSFLYNQQGVHYEDGIFVASKERAVADMLYFNPKYHLDFKRGINKAILKTIKREIYG